MTTEGLLKILAFASKHNPMAKFLDQLSTHNGSDQTIERCFFLSELETRVIQPHPDINLVIVCINDAREIIGLTKMRERLLDIKLVIVLPFRDDDMISWAYKLGPRFIAYADDDTHFLESALRKMLDPFT